MAPLSDSRSLVLIGFMGAGKSRALKAARAAGLEALDSDELLEAELGMPIAEFFEAHGEPEFRRREHALVAELLERGPDVVALGGGAVLSEGIRAALADQVVVLLDVDSSTAWSRVGGRRPLARDRQTFERLLAERTPLYRSLADAIVPAEHDAVARALPALLELRGLPASTRMAWGRSSSGEYPVYVGRGVLGSVARPGTGRSFVITDSTVGELFAERIGETAAVIAVDPGEGAKTLQEAERVLRELVGHGATRSDHVIALGGGVVGDLAGFCAAVYQRGIPVVQVPTTLVSQVDSAYGGKTGVDLPEGKNYVGSYHLPAAVFTDLSTLASLPAPELAAGFAEVVKTALIAGGQLWADVSELRVLDADSLDEIIFACVQTKLAVVAEDERDSGRRAALNLGHTVGHAIEAASGYERYRHGEAIAIGLLAALELSDAERLREQVAAILERAGLPTSIDPAIDRDRVIAAIGRDKKVTAEGLGFVLCRAPGEVVTGQSVDPGALEAAVARLYDS